MSLRGLMLTALVVGLLSATGCQRSKGVDMPAPPPPAASPPDFSGIWEPALGEWQAGQRPRSEWLERSKPQFTPEYEAKHHLLTEIYSFAETKAVTQYNARDYAIVRRMVGECVPYGMPQMMAADGDGASETMSIAQTRDLILIVGEGGLGPHVRQIYMDREQLPIEQVEPSYMGRSVGKWQGNVLVINTVGVKKELEGQDLMPHSEQMVITERISLVDGVLMVDLTITDPLALEKPWSYSARFRRVAKDYEPTEGYCENSNHYRFGKDGKLIVE